MGQLSAGTWKVGGSDILLIAQPKIPEATIKVSFSGARMAFGSEVHEHPSAELTSALDRATAGSTAPANWTSVPLAP
jgi:hypothetical protein